MSTKLAKLMDKYRKNIATYDTSECTEDYEVEEAYEDFKNSIQSLMKRMNTTKFFAYGLSLTWSNVAGYTTFETDKPEVFIRKISPQSDYRMKIYTTDKRGIFEVVTYYHDKPCGETLYLMSQTMAIKQQIMKQYFS